MYRFVCDAESNLVIFILMVCMNFNHSMMILTGCQWINIDTSNTNKDNDTNSVPSNAASAIIDNVEVVNDSGNAFDDGGFIHIA